MKLRIGTRGSDLALWQANTVRGWLEAVGAEVEIVVLETRGDRIDDLPLTKVEGKAFFTAEIERALLDRTVDVAVHSHKDLATESPPGLAVAAVPARGPHAERLLIRPEHHEPEAAFLPLVRGARVGTSAPRRETLLHALRPDLRVEPLRGNVPTRVRKLREGRHDAIVLAAAGIERLGLDLDDLVVAALPPATFVPAPAQGALAIQTRSDDDEVRDLCRRAAHDPETAAVITAERRVLVAAGGGCSLPLGAWIVADGAGFVGRAFLAADHPSPGAPPRWVVARDSTPDGAARELIAELAHGRAGNAGPFAGRRVALAGAGHAGRLAQRLTELGAEVVLERVIELEDLPAPELDERLAELGPGDVVALTSRRAASRLAGRAPCADVTVAAVGPTTAEAARAAGWPPALVGGGGAAELAAALPIEAGTRVLFPHAEDPIDDLPRIVAERGGALVGVPVYRTRPIPGVEPTPGVDARVFQSPSAVRALPGAAAGSEGCSTVALGRSTWQALADAGCEAEPTDASGPENAIRALARRLAAARPSAEGMHR